MGAEMTWCCFLLGLLITWDHVCLGREKRKSDLFSSFLFNKYLLSTYYGQASVNSLCAFPKIVLDFPEKMLLPKPCWPTWTSFLLILTSVWNWSVGSFSPWLLLDQKMQAYSHLPLSSLNPSHSVNTTQPTLWFPWALFGISMKHEWLIPTWIS